MIRRTLTGGLLATVAMLALVPTAADAAPAAPAPRAAVSATAPNPLPGRALPPAHRVNHSATHRRSHHALGRVVTHRASLNVRSGPGTGYRVIGVRHAGRLVALRCRTYGSRVHGTHQWYRLARVRGYVSAHYVRVVRGTVPWC
ncbi:SH3 domain-containing protein [Streptomyces sp. NRRL S-340]|uniref:SH3 domain-containing protein n=1 Tax=Streptomyces sp. NRRL S-340 TaxID=1463901 RepID=UPI00055CA522|nr:SH3 domain-containing protein [Streptomyces sp. NRRL S-340]